MKLLVVGLVAIAALVAQEPADVLERARDKLLPRLPRTTVCTETIDRSYLRPNTEPSAPASCEQISLDRKSGKARLHLEATDRLRIDVTVMQSREVFTWTGPGSFSRKVDEILEPGPMGTGEFATLLLGVFINPAFRFRVLDQSDRHLEFGFRVPVEASSLFVRAGGEWRASGFDGSFVIDPASLEIKRLITSTSELPPDTSMCEGSTAIDYPSGGAGLLVPLKAVSHQVMRDTTETDRVTTFSNCRESTEVIPSGKPGFLAIPGDILFELALTNPLYTATAAAGDVISAKVIQPILDPMSEKVLVPAGAVVTGRILLMEHPAKKQFLISVAFDRIEINGVISAFAARMNKPLPFKLPQGERYPELQKDRMDAFVFSPAKPGYVVPAGYPSKWRTVAPPSK